MGKRGRILEEEKLKDSCYFANLNKRQKVSSKSQVDRCRCHERR